MALSYLFNDTYLHFNGTDFGANLPWRRHFSDTELPVEKSLQHPLLRASRCAPQHIDSHLRPYLHSQTLLTELEALMSDYVNTGATPGVYEGGIRSHPQWFYANCAVFGMLLGRAFTLLSTPARPPKSLDNPEDFAILKLPTELRLMIYDYYKDDLDMRQKWWEGMTRVFVKALWSGRDAEEGARYVMGIIMLTSGVAMSGMAWMVVVGWWVVCLFVSRESG